MSGLWSLLLNYLRPVIFKASNMIYSSNKQPSYEIASYYSNKITNNWIQQQAPMWSLGQDAQAALRRHGMVERQGTALPNAGGIASDRVGRVRRPELPITGTSVQLKAPSL